MLAGSLSPVRYTTNEKIYIIDRLTRLGIIILQHIQRERSGMILLLHTGQVHLLY